MLYTYETFFNDSAIMYNYITQKKLSFLTSDAVDVLQLFLQETTGEFSATELSDKLEISPAVAIATITVVSSMGYVNIRMRASHQCEGEPVIVDWPFGEGLPREDDQFVCPACRETLLGEDLEYDLVASDCSLGAG